MGEFDGWWSSGAGVALPGDWYVKGQGPLSPLSERTRIEIAVIESFLSAGKPVFASCFGMQLLAGMHGCKLRSDLHGAHEQTMHDVTVMEGTRLLAITGAPRLHVNSKHNEAVAEASARVIVSARADDGLIEAIEIPGRSFAIGLQWHQEKFWSQDHPGNAVVQDFIRQAESAR